MSITFFLQHLAWRVKSPYSNPSLMTNPHRRTQKQKGTIMNTSIRQICGWMDREWIRIKINLHSHFWDLPCIASCRKLCNKNLRGKKSCHFVKNTANQPNQAAGSLQMMWLWCNCGGTGVAIVVIMEAVMERQGWQKWWWFGSVVAVYSFCSHTVGCIKNTTWYLITTFEFKIICISINAHWAV